MYKYSFTLIKQDLRFDVTFFGPYCYSINYFKPLFKSYLITNFTATYVAV